MKVFEKLIESGYVDEAGCKELREIVFKEGLEYYYAYMREHMDFYDAVWVLLDEVRYLEDGFWYPQNNNGRIVEHKKPVRDYIKKMQDFSKLAKEWDK